jgi:hypothetical protein
VLFHFKRADVPAMIEKIYNALAKNGRFAFSLKAGDGEEWLLEKMNAPRFFCYWQETDIKKILRSAGFVKMDIKTIASKTRQVQWLKIVAHK